MSAADTLASVQDQYFSIIKQTQGFVLDAVRTAGKTVEPLVRDLPQVPFADELPSAEDAVKAGFDFVEKLVAVEREFATQLADALGKPSASA